MKKETDTELQSLHIIAEMVMKFAQLHVLNIKEEDWKLLNNARQCLEKVIHDNGYRLNYDKNLKNHLIKL